MPDTPETWRLFIAIDLGPAAREALRAAQDECRRLDLPARWVDTRGAHLTLKFLGDTDRALVAPLGDALRAIAADHRPFALRTAAPGIFPNLRRPRVLWLGIDGALNRLAQLHRATDAALVPLGFSPETRPFSPHLTLGRVRDDRARDIAAATPRLDTAFARVAAQPGAPLPVEAIHLIRSELHPSGALYTRLVSAQLGHANG